MELHHFGEQVTCISAFTSLSFKTWFKTGLAQLTTTNPYDEIHLYLIEYNSDTFTGILVSFSRNFNERNTKIRNLIRSPRTSPSQKKKIEDIFVVKKELGQFRVK